jgi:UDP-N-acetylmuramoyl-tripeptide--D-alanyl-D-alanine ligase
MNIEKIHQLFLKFQTVCTDTRKIEPNCIFFCLKGDNFDANSFADEALNKGAAFVIIDNGKFYQDEKTILVTDVLKTLQELANFHRNFLELPIIALTGSNGKTTSKELIQVVLSKKFTAKATIGNLNNHIGVPLTLLSFDESTEIGIVEMGANHQKEIEFLCKIAQPDYGYITNFGKAHLEGFGGIEGVIKGKSELYDFLKESKKMAFVNLDDDIQKNKTAKIKRYTFSTKDKNANIILPSIESDEFAKTKLENLIITSNLVGNYNVTNINAAKTIGKYFEIDNILIKEAIEEYIPSNNRSQLIQLKGNEIILDCYNANPSSMQVAIDNFLNLNKKNKWLILGDMFELGEESVKEHAQIVNLLKNIGNHQVSFIGERFFEHQIEAKNLHFYKSYDEFASSSKNKNIQNKCLLIKGSRGMALERILNLI